MLRSLILPSATVLFMTAALAQEAAFLTRAEMETLAAGKVWNLISLTRQSKVRRDIQGNGLLYRHNVTLKLSDTAKWTASDAGQICLDLRGGSRDGCSAVKKVDKKHQLFFDDTPDVLAREFTVQ